MQAKHQENKTSNQSYTGLTGAVTFEKNDDVNYYGHTYMAADEGLSDSDWIYDTGSCHTFIKSKDIFIDYKPLTKPRCYTAASGDPVTAIGVGTIKFRTGFAELIVKNALYAANAHTSIISVYRLRQSGYRTEEGPDLLIEFATLKAI
jgi:Pol polyprotein